MMNFRLLNLLLIFSSVLSINAQQPQPIRQFVNSKELKGASFSILVKDLDTNESIYAYDTDRELIPASVMKLFTSATALEVLGEEFRYQTNIEYDGEIADGVLKGNLYIKGSGDPTLGSSHIVPEGTKNVFEAQQQFIRNWIKAIKEAGIHTIEGSLIADETVFDTEGVPMKWLHEDMGSYYGAGSYSISVFDNIYRLLLKTGQTGSCPTITGCIPDIPSLIFHNYLTCSTKDSSYIVGYPYSNDRFLYGTVPASKDQVTLRGDIPDPGLFLAQYLARSLSFENIRIEGQVTTSRLLIEEDKWSSLERTLLISTFSPPLTEITKILNQKSHNLYTDAVLKTLGLQYKEKNNEVLSSFGKGISFVKNYWKTKGMDVSSLWMFDGSGVAPTDKITTQLICDLLTYMYTTSPNKEAYLNSLPKVGEEGSVRNLLKGTNLQGKARLKSGGMSRVRSYAGYIELGEKRYVMAIIVNNYHGEGRNMINQIEKLLLTLFPS